MTVKQKTVNLELMRYTPKWAKRLSARRALVVAMYTIPTAALLLRITVTTGWFSSLAGWAAVLLTLLCWGWVVGATRSAAELPDDYLDERERSTRDRSYRLAYACFTGAIGLAVLYLYFAVDAPRLQLPLPSAASSTLWFWAVFYPAMSLPSAMYAWLEPDAVQDD